MRKKILAYIIAVLTITTCMIQLIPRQNNIFKIASQGEGESGFLTNNNLNQKKVYLTFDDGPSDHTDEILDILKKNNINVTIRREFGSKVMAACGQLRANYEEEK